MANVNPTTRIPGIDVSRYQGPNIDWSKVAAAGYKFAILKCSDGSTGKDRTFAINRKRAAEAGLIVGSYHFYRPKRGVKAQIRNFLDTLGELKKGELAPVGDFEQHELWAGISKKAAADMAVEWLTSVQEATGVNPFYYSSFAFPKDVMGADKRLAGFPLWLARYRRKEDPAAPAPWRTWTLWQYGDTGSVPGVTGPCDQNLFFSSRRSTLLKFTKQ